MLEKIVIKYNYNTCLTYVKIITNIKGLLYAFQAQEEFPKV